MSISTRSSPASSPQKRPRLTTPIKMAAVVGSELISPLKPGGTARDLLSGALNDAWKSQEKPEDVLNGMEINSLSGSPNKSPTKGIRRKRRKDEKQSSDYHHTFVMKLFDKSVDLAQFPATTPLYPVCRAWMRNEPSNIDQAPRARSITPPPPTPNPEGEEEEEEDDYPDVYNLPAPEPNQGEKCLRIPEVPSLPLEGVDLAEEGAENNTAPAILLSNHMVRWIEVRKSWKKAAQKNEKRFEKSLNILQQMFDDN